jgi:signal recognition particle receptor subunit beta
MSLINYVSKEIHCKIVYFGPGMGGKTTNVQYIYDHTGAEQRGKFTWIPGENERTLFFDFLPLAVGDVKGYKTRFHLYTVPGQTFYDFSRDFILKGVDGIIFVADSQEERMEANIESKEALEKSLDQNGYEFGKLPVVFQYNKRDLPNPVPLQELEATLNPTRRPFVEATAKRGIGVMETLEKISEMVLQNLKGGTT